MNKLSLDPITQSDIEDYLTDYSDFSFELRVLKQLSDLGLDCEYSGTYDDPITGKSREFDIRASYVLGKYRLSVYLSVECKNIQDNYPLVTHCLKRRRNESYNELVFTFNPERHLDNEQPSQIIVSQFLDKSESIRVEDKNTLYQEGELVAKSADQVGKRDDKSRTIMATDNGVFEKISQAINSATDLISESHEIDTEQDDYLTLICPVLVIPDSVLWRVKYLDDGTVDGSPELIKHISYYFGKQWTVGSKLQKLTYTLSHLEIVTFSELKPFIENYLGGYIKSFESKIDEILYEQ
jgi:hypothetical protein